MVFDLSFIKKIIILLFFFCGAVSAQTWEPKPKFNIENSNIESTLTFISGMAYALTESNIELKKQGKENFMCNSSPTIGSKVIIDILNEKYKGSISSEQAIVTVIEGLKYRYPCE